MSFATSRKGQSRVDLYFEAFGDPQATPLLLVSGLGSQCLSYHVDWCDLFVAAGLRVARFDNRDAGLSTKANDSSIADYTLTDMADDAFAVLDAIKADACHVMGISMGGMIAQTMAIRDPSRVLSLTSVMSDTGEPEFGTATEEAWALLTAPAATDRATYIEHALAGFKVWGSPAFGSAAERKEGAEAAFDRCFDPAATARQLRAVQRSERRDRGLRELAVPTLVIHGDADTLIPPDAGARTAELVPGSRFVLVGGMGHDYPRELWPYLTSLVVDHIAATTSA